MNFTKGECGCKTYHDRLGRCHIQYCSLHGVAPVMREALKLVERGDGGKCMRGSCRLYEGKPDSRCFHEGFLPKCSPTLKAQWKAIDEALAKAEEKGGDSNLQQKIDVGRQKLEDKL